MRGDAMQVVNLDTLSLSGEADVRAKNGVAVGHELIVVAVIVLVELSGHLWGLVRS